MAFTVQSDGLGDEEEPHSSQRCQCHNFFIISVHVMSIVSFSALVAAGVYVCVGGGDAVRPSLAMILIQGSPCPVTAARDSGDRLLVASPHQARIQGVGAGARAHPWGGVSPFKMHYSTAFKHQFITGRPPLGEILYPPLLTVPVSCRRGQRGGPVLF